VCVCVCGCGCGCGCACVMSCKKPIGNGRNDNNVVSWMFFLALCMYNPFIVFVCVKPLVRSRNWVWAVSDSGGTMMNLEFALFVPPGTDVEIC